MTIKTTTPPPTEMAFSPIWSYFDIKTDEHEFDFQNHYFTDNGDDAPLIQHEVYLTTERGRPKFFLKRGRAYYQITVNHHDHSISISSEKSSKAEKDLIYLFTGTTNFLSFYISESNDGHSDTNMDQVKLAMDSLRHLHSMVPLAIGNHKMSGFIFGMIRRVLVIARREGVLHNPYFDADGFQDSVANLQNYNNYIEHRDPWCKLILAVAGKMNYGSIRMLFQSQPKSGLFLSNVKAIVRFLSVAGQASPLASVRALHYLKMPIFTNYFHELEFLMKQSSFNTNTSVAKEISIYLAEAEPMVEIAFGPMPDDSFVTEYYDFIYSDLNLPGQNQLYIPVPIRLNLGSLRGISQNGCAPAIVSHMTNVMRDPEFIWTPTILKKNLAKVVRAMDGLKDLSWEDQEKVISSAIELLNTFKNSNVAGDASYRVPAGPANSLIACFSYVLAVTNNYDLKVRQSLTMVLAAYARNVIGRFKSQKVVERSLSFLMTSSFQPLNSSSAVISSQQLTHTRELKKHLRVLLSESAVQKRLQKTTSKEVFNLHSLLKLVYPVQRPVKLHFRRNKGHLNLKLAHVNTRVSRIDWVKADVSSNDIQLPPTLSSSTSSEQQREESPLTPTVLLTRSIPSLPEDPQIS